MFNFFKQINKYQNNNNHKYCKYINESIIFDYKNNVKFCPYSNLGIITSKFDGIWLDIEKLKKIKSESINIINSINCPSTCKTCEYFSVNKKNENDGIKYLYLSNWKNCYLNCSYCDFPKEEDLIKASHYDVFQSIKQLIDSKLIDVNTTIIFNCGDATIHPEFDKLLYYFINYEMKKIIINTPAMRYCESISEAIAKNIAEVIIPFDSGCPYIFEKIKEVCKIDRDYDVSIILVDACEIHNINKTYRNIDRPTDVISFALKDSEDEMMLEEIEAELGDIFISVDAVCEQVKEYGHSECREISFLCTHGLLHLLGYDHMNDEDEKEMFALQDVILDGFTF